MDFQMVAPCLFGLEGLVAGELRAMGARAVQAQNGRVLFQGDMQMLACANLNVRYAERIQILLAMFPAKTPDELFYGVQQLPWEAWIDRTDAFPVKGHSLDSHLASVPACQSMVKKGIVERLKKVYHVPWLEETGAIHQVQFLLMKDQAHLMLDTSGVGLHKRGYRAHATEAPIKETLAAAMAYLAHVRGDSVLYDPFCGSGTILIESALHALQIAPGLRRRFAAEKWRQIPEEVWLAERRRAQERIRRDRPFVAYGMDIDNEAVRLTQENAIKAGLGKRIYVEKRDIVDFQPRSDGGILLCNPPYGERLLDIQQAEQLYQKMGQVFPNNENWSCGIITPDEDFEKVFGRRAEKRRKLYNGMIRCQFYWYPGGKKRKKQE